MPPSDQEVKDAIRKALKRIVIPADCAKCAGMGCEAYRPIKMTPAEREAVQRIMSAILYGSTLDEQGMLFEVINEIVAESFTQRAVQPEERT